MGWGNYPDDGSCTSGTYIHKDKVKKLQKKIAILSEAIEDILYCGTITHEINCIALDAKDKINEVDNGG